MFMSTHTDNKDPVFWCCCFCLLKGGGGGVSFFDAGSCFSKLGGGHTFCFGGDMLAFLSFHVCVTHSLCVISVSAGMKWTVFFPFSFNRVALCMLVLHYIVEFVFHVARLCYFSEKSDLAANAWVVSLSCSACQGSVSMHTYAHTPACLHN